MEFPGDWVFGEIGRCQRVSFSGRLALLGGNGGDFASLRIGLFPLVLPA